jgi:hypothetical protein
VPSTPEPPVVTVTPHDSPTTPSEPSSTGHDPGKHAGSSVPARAAGETISGVLAATTRVGHATLPFTGFPLWAAVLAAAVLVGTGLPLRRVARAHD